ncbi:hypothetical protein V6N00_05935 [Tersicoccus sp. MR15.9]
MTGEKTVPRTSAPMTSARRIGAILLIVLGALALVAGIGMRTWWLPPATLSASAPAPSAAAPVTVIEGGVADLGRRTDVTVSVKGAGAFTVAQGRASDVDAWVGRAAHTTVTGRDGRLTAKPTAGEARVPDPSGADLFVSAQRATGELSRPWTTPAAGDWALLLTADGSAAAPTDVTVSWHNDQSTPWAAPLIILGAIALVAGLALLILRRRGPAAPASRRGRHAAVPAPAPRRGATGRTTAASSGAASSGAASSDARSGGTTSRRGVLPVRPVVVSSVAGVLAAGLLPTGCVTAAQAADSPSTSLTGAATTVPSTTVPSTATSTSAATDLDSADVALQPHQVDRIMASVASVVGRAYGARSAAGLQARMAGGALTERTANYRIRAKAPTYRAPARIDAGPVLVPMITTSPTWPRTVVLVTRAAASTVPQILTLTQTSPRENYRVVSAVGLLPGTTFPQAGSDAVAVRPLDPSRADGLTSTPRAALTSVAAVLTAGRTAYTGAVAKNPFVDQLIAGQAAAVKANPSARISGRHTPDATQTRVLQTSDRGALVIGTLRNAVSVTPKDRNGRLTLRSELAALAGTGQSRTPVDIAYGESVVLYVPPAGSHEAVQVIGAAQELLSVTRR